MAGYEAQEAGNVKAHEKSDDVTARVVESVVLRGDISALSPQDRAKFYIQMCEQLGLNPSTQPLAPLKLNGKEILYPTRGATDQLAAKHRLNREIIDGPKVIDMLGTKLGYCVCRVTTPDGRSETATASLPIGGDISMLPMKLETKAKRRATLSILGLGMLDETEIDSIPAHEKAPGQPIDLGRARPVEAPAPSLPLSVQRLADDLAQLGDGLSVEQIAGCVRDRYDAIAEDGADALIDAQGVAKAHAPAGTKGRVGAVFDECGRELARQRAEAAQAAALPAPEAPTRAVAVEAEETHPALVALRDALAQAGTLADVAARANEAAEELRSLTEGDRHLAWQMACAAAERVTGVDAREAAAKLRDAMRGPEGDGPRGGKRAKPKAALADAAASSAAATASDATQARAPSPDSAHFVESAEAWEAHCLAYASVFHLENGWAKHSPAFSAAGVYEARLETAALRLQAITAFAGDIDALKTRLRTVSRKADERAMQATQSERLARVAA